MPDATANPPEIVSVRMPSRLELLSVIDRVTQSLCERMGLDDETASQVTMAVIEAGTNAIQHGHQRDPAKEVDVRFAMYGDRLEVDVSDRGPGFEIAEVNGNVTAPEHLLDLRGRGIFIMRSCMDAVDFRFSGGGTVCHMVKNRPAQTPAD